MEPRAELKEAKRLVVVRRVPCQVAVYEPPAPRHLLVHREDVAEELVDDLRVNAVEEGCRRRHGVVPQHVERQVG